jgi:hypothetical protein
MTGRTISTFREALRRLTHDDRGISLVLVAMVLAALVMMAGLGVETGLWYTEKRAAQTAADMAARSGAMELAAGKSYLSICALARRDAASNGFVFDPTWACPIQSPSQQSQCNNLTLGQMCVNNPPVFPQSASNPQKQYMVEVVLVQQPSTMFASLLGLTTVTIGTRAVAAVPQGPGSGVACSMGLDGPPGNGSDGKDVYLRGNPTVTLNCTLVSNSTSADAVDVQGSSTLNATQVYTAGNCTGSCPSTTTPYAPKLPDPYAGQISYTLPTNSTNCVNAPTSGSISPPAAGTFYCPMSITGNATLAAGIYYIDDKSGGNAFSVTGGTVTGNGVTIISSAPSGTTKAGTFNIAAGATVTLSAPTTSNPSGCTASSPPCIPSGILFYQDPAVADTSCVKNNIQTSTNCNTLTANSSGALTGVIYTPKTVAMFQGNNSTSGCLVVIALAIIYSGDSTISASQSACSSAGVNTPPTIIRTVLAE